MPLLPEDDAFLRELERQGFIERATFRGTSLNTNKRKCGVVRLYNHTAYQLWLLLDYLQRNNVRLETIHSYVNPDGSDNGLYTAWQTVRAYPNENVNIVDLIETIRSQIERGGDGDSTLVDSIVHALGLPYGLNRFSNVVMEQLKKAVLRPDEIAALKQVLIDSMRCYVCKAPIGSGELLVGNSSGASFNIRCFKCGSSETATCPVCGLKHSLGAAVRTRLIKTFTCPTCKGNGQQANIDPNQINAGTGINLRDI